MNRPDIAKLSRHELLRVDELCDQIEASLKADPLFDVDQFIDSVESESIRVALRAELACLYSQTKASVEVIHAESTDHSGRMQPFVPGAIVDSFELIESVGCGATSTVWKARHLDLDRFVALKFPTHFSAGVAQRILRESKAVAKLRHPNIAAIHEIRTGSNGGYLVSEFIDGLSLHERMEENPLDLAEVVDLMISITEAIAYSHSMNVIHRDIKPQNILLDSADNPYVVDFGLARILHSDLVVLTNEGDMIGTPGYMSPEQALGHQDVGEASDIYSLGVLFFQLLTGRLPFLGEVQSVVHQIIHQPTPGPRDIVASTPNDLEIICLKCMEKSPSNRFATARELAFELHRYRNGEPIVSRSVPRTEKVLRWAKRKPAEAVLAGLLLLCVVGMTAGSLAFAMTMSKSAKNEFNLRTKAEASEQTALRLKDEVENALQESVRQHSIAELRAKESKSSAEFLQSIFTEPDAFMWVVKGDGVGGGDPPSLRILFENSAARIESDFPGDNRAKANFMEMLGGSCRSLGYFDLSEDLLTSAKSNRNQVLQSDAETGIQNTDLDRFGELKNAAEFAQLIHDRGQFHKAIAAYQKCIAQAKHITGDQKEEADGVRGELLFHMGRLQLTLHRNPAALNSFTRATEVFDGMREPNRFLQNACELAIEYGRLKPGDVPSMGRLGEYFQNDSWAQKLVARFSEMLVFRASGNLETAVERYKVVLATLREKLPEEHQWHLMALGDFADLLRKAGYYDDAFDAIKVVMEHGERIAPHHPHLIRAQIDTGKELVRANQTDSGVRYLEKALSSLRNQPRLEEATVNADLCLELLDQYGNSGRTQDALELCKELEKHTDSWTLMETAWFRHLKSKAYLKHAPSKAISLAQQSQADALSLDHLPENGIWCERLAKIFLQAKNTDRAIEAAEAAVRHDIGHFFKQHPRVANRRVFLGQCYHRCGDIEAAKAEFETALKIRLTYFRHDNPLIDELQAILSEFDEQH